MKPISRKSSMKLNRILNLLFILVWFLLGVFGIQSCSKHVIVEPLTTPQPTIATEFIDQSWFNDEPCLGPCWYDLHLEISTLEETLITVENLSFIDHIEKADVSYGTWDFKSKQIIPSISYFGYCVEPKDQKCVQLLFSDNILKEIDIYTNQYFSFNNIVLTIGEPDKILVRYTYPETISYCTVMLFWENRDVVMMHNFAQDHEWEYYINFSEIDLCKVIMENSYKIPNSLSIDKVIYITQALSIYETHSREVREWNGFLGE